MSRGLGVRPRHALPVVTLLAAVTLVAPAAQAAPEHYRYWNHPYRKHDTCIKLRFPMVPPPVRWADWEEVDGPLVGYHVRNPGRWKPNSGETTCEVNNDFNADSPYVRIDLTERLQTRRALYGDTATLYFHKGGQGYIPDRTPYGHMWRSDLETAPEPVRTKTQLDAEGAFPIKPDGAADSTGFGAGRKCAAMSPLTQYAVTSAEGPPNVDGDSWVVDDFRSSGGNYHKYGNAGRLQGDGSVSFQYLQWSWVGQDYWKDGQQLVANRIDGRGKTSGYGAVRTILKPGTIVTRCNVASITSRAYKADTNQVAGRVTGVYVRVTVGDNTLYGWLMHSYQRYLGGDPASSSSYGARQCVLAPAADPRACDAAPPESPSQHDYGCCLGPDQTLHTDDYLISDDGRYRLVMQYDGNLVEYGPNGAEWASNTFGNTGARAIMQLDGNFVIYTTDNRPIWSTNTFAGRSTLVVQNDSNLVIYGPNGPVWSRW